MRQCGRPMSISYGGHRRGRSHRVYQYRCCTMRGRLAAQDCQLIGGKRIDQAVAQAFLEATEPAALEAARQANQLVRQENEQLARYWRHQVEKAEYEAQRAER